MAAGLKACLEYLEDRTACLSEALAKVKGQEKSDECWHWRPGPGLLVLRSAKQPANMANYKMIYRKYSETIKQEVEVEQ